MTTTRIHGWTVEMFADLDDGGNVTGYSAEQIEAMNDYLDRQLGEDLVDAETEEEARDMIESATRQALALADINA